MDVLFTRAHTVITGSVKLISDMYTNKFFGIISKIIISNNKDPFTRKLLIITLPFMESSC